MEGTRYFPRKAVKMDYLKRSDKQYNCPWKGDAEYFHVSVNGTTLRDAAWSYPDTKTAAAVIEGHIAFDKEVQVS